VSFLCVAPRVWERIAGIAGASTTWTWLRTRRYLQELRQTRLHAGRVVVLALETALDEPRAGRRAGAPGPYRKPACASAASSPTWASNRSRTRAGESHTISTFRLPPPPTTGLTVEGMYEGLKQRGFHRLPRQG